MSDTKSNTSTVTWTGVQAYTLAVICLLLGMAGGWLIRGSQSSAAPVQAASAPAPSAMGAAPNAQPTPEQLKQMADTQAAPMLEKLKSDPNNPELLSSIGNFYYDAQQFPIAVDYYKRALKAKPADAAVRTDMATAYWYMGNADEAIAEFNKSLTYEPNKPNTLFNRGMVKWQGKMDINGAVADWEKLLATNPNYEGKDKVEQMIAEAKKHSDVKPGTKAKPLPQ
ncbi:MAG TPA: tetratricopeptide repeat protein [Terriglobales bacterium]|nr:tetratricopeptide repeat protein [Terriglobales bacterium]